MLVRPVMKRLLFSLENQAKKRLASLARLIIMYWLYVMLLTAEQGAGERNYYALLGKTGEHLPWNFQSW